MGIEKVTIVGMGALGVMYGDFFSRKLGKESFEFVSDKKRIDKYNEEGVFCNGQRCDFLMADENEEGKPADLLIFAVKSTGLDEAIKTVRNKVSKDTIILSVLNGISSEEIIGRAYGMDKIIHCIVQGMDASKIKNQLSYTQFGHICIGIDQESEEKKGRLRAVLEIFDETGMPYILDEDIMHRIWSKFMLNVGLNQTVMIYEGTYGTVQKPGRARDLMESAMKEVMLLAKKEGVNLTQKDYDDYIKLVDQMNPEGMPSMRQDGLQRKKSEVEFFSGTLIRLAQKHNIDLPVNREIYDTIIRIESQY